MPMLLIKEEHKDGHHSIVWYNAPHDLPTIFKVFSHFNDHSAIKAGKQRVYSATSLPEVVSLINLIYSNPLKDKAGSGLVDYILDRTSTGEGKVHDLIHLQADLIEYCEDNDIQIDNIVSSAKDLFDA